MTIAQKLDELLQKDQDKIERWFTQNLQYSRAFKRAFIRQWLAELSEFDTDDTGRVIIPTMPNRQRLDNLIKTIRQALEQAGLQEYTEQLVKSLDKRVRTANTLWNQLKFDPAKIENLDELPVVLEHIQNVRNSVIRGSVAQEQELYGALLQFSRSFTEQGVGIDYANLKRTLVSKAGILPKYAGTIANTELFGLSRTIRKEQGVKAGLEYAKYYGPLDKITRPFCARHVGTIENWEYWSNVLNDTGPQPPSIYGGGYNCRHSLVPTDPDWDNIEWD